jgi:hypothetical protein
MSQDFTYLQSRLDGQAQWHSDKATWNKRSFYAVEIITLVSGALIPVINLLGPEWQSWQRVGSTTLAIIVVISTGIGKLLKFQENWLTYRGLAEELKREKEFYLNGVGNYGNEDEPGRQKLLVQRIEDILSTTTTSFIALHRAEREQPKDAKKP